MTSVDRVWDRLWILVVTGGTGPMECLFGGPLAILWGLHLLDSPSTLLSSISWQVIAHYTDEFYLGWAAVLIGVWQVTAYLLDHRPQRIAASLTAMLWWELYAVITAVTNWASLAPVTYSMLSLIFLWVVLRHTGLLADREYP